MPSRDSSSGLPAAPAMQAPAPARSDVSSTSDVPAACGTLRDVATSDAVKIEGSTLFYAETAGGLTLVDVSEPTKPRKLATIPFVGMPRALFVRDGIAWVVFTDFDARHADDGAAATIVRAIDVTNPEKPVLLGDQVRSGHPRDAKLVGGVLYTLMATKDGSAVESFSVRRGKLDWRDKVALEGAPAQLAASSAGLAVVTTFENDSRVTWLDLPLDLPGTLMLRETLRTPGGVATWDRGDGRVVDADDGQRVRLVTCMTKACAPEEGATLRVLDFGGTASPRLTASLRITERGGLPLTRFSNELLYVGETSATAPDTTLLHVVRTDEARPRLAATLPLRGLVSGFVARDTSLVALGTTASPETQVRIAVYDIDVRKPDAPRVRGSATFGSDWTWSPALDDEGAVSFDPSSHLVAIPFTAWRYADKRYVTGTQLVDLGRRGAQNVDTVPGEGFVERAVFLDGHLVTIGPEGIHAVDYGPARRTDMAEQPLDLGGRAPLGR
ncbi:MAG: beta-propeller domain-containing protein [Deltaproteobacteria bacterium]|nr:beta-propeller domain-containing protein [Deltaproteobacteria bacterium]